MKVVNSGPLVSEQGLSFKVGGKIQQVLTPEGDVVGAIPNLSGAELVGFYRWMVLGRAYSERMVALQRQGRMGTFAPLTGQEATSVGIAAPLESDDWLLASYRENISHLVKGIPILALMKQWGGHFADNFPRELKAPPFQIVLGAQMLHGVGVAQAIKYNNQPNVVLAACGDGATSEGDFNEALNFAGVFKIPAVFVVQNNGWAISTPREHQTAAKYIADRGAGFGIPSCVVDGNDVLAVFQVVSDAIARARAGEGPTLIEAITYRLGAHTTADDPTKYRPETEVELWTRRDPIARFRKFLVNCNMLAEAEDTALHEAVETEIEAAVEAYEALLAPSPDQQFAHVYASMPPQLQRQRGYIPRHLGLEIVSRNGSYA
jgi:pyruvate dehydrogenase E1 component alpha subunit